ncbi:MAG: sugar kinase [Sphingobium sp.]|nr:sugar kinase [Sphingobium sp.]
MLELTRADGQARLGTAGDTLNTAIHLARQGLPTAYLTALGMDSFSDEMLATWAAEGLDCRLVLRHPNRQPGLYAVTTDERGERSFTYWRGESAAREMFALPDMARLMPHVAQARLFYFSLLSLAILPFEGRQALLALAAAVRKGGGQVAFDSNYRPAMWSTPAEARQWRDAAIAVADLGLPTLDDEQRLEPGIDAAAAQRTWTALGCDLTIMKLGPAGCRLPDGQIIAPPAVLAPVDTAGAGDAFNAGFIAAWLAGTSLEAAAAAGHRLAGWTIMRPGALPARD